MALQAEVLAPQDFYGPGLIAEMVAASPLAGQAIPVDGDPRDVRFNWREMTPTEMFDAIEWPWPSSKEPEPYDWSLECDFGVRPYEWLAP